MSLTKNSQTNWKYILVVAALAIIIGFGIWGYLKCFNREIISHLQFSEIKKPEKIEFSEETINKIINEPFQPDMIKV